MKDIYGIKLKLGDTVKTEQPSGGLLAPARPQIGEVVYLPKGLGNDLKKTFHLRYKRVFNGATFYSYIDLKGKINEII
jgi:hypothetical protein